MQCGLAVPASSTPLVSEIDWGQLMIARFLGEGLAIANLVVQNRIWALCSVNRSMGGLCSVFHTYERSCQDEMRTLKLKCMYAQGGSASSLGFFGYRHNGIRRPSQNIPERPCNKVMIHVRGITPTPPNASVHI